MTQSNVNVQNANERSFNEAMPQVVNPSTAAADQKEKSDKGSSVKKQKRSNFYIARERTMQLYDKSMQVFQTLDISVSEDDKKKYLKKFLVQALSEMKTYNEDGFKKDLSMRMARLINDKRFDRSCKRAHKALWKQAELLAWSNQTTFDLILAQGIDHVKGFATPCVLLYDITDIRADILFNDVVEDDLNGRYEKEWEDKQPKDENPQDAPKAPEAPEAPAEHAA